MWKEYLVYYLIFLGVMNVLAFIFYKIDKVKAMNNKFRIPEATLLFFGFFGGSLGALLSMQIFRHKTKHLYFYIVNGLGLIAQLVLLYFFIF